MSQLLEKLIPGVITRLRHEGTAHPHTLANIIEEDGQFWLEIRCRHKDCPGYIRRKLPPDLARQWQEEETR